MQMLVAVHAIDRVATVVFAGGLGLRVISNRDNDTRAYLVGDLEGVSALKQVAHPLHRRALVQ